MATTRSVVTAVCGVAVLVLAGAFLLSYIPGHPAPDAPPMEVRYAPAPTRPTRVTHGIERSTETVSTEEPEQRLTEPRSTEPRSTEPRSPEPRSPEPRLTEPRLTEPRSTESSSNEQRSTESRSTEPRLMEPRLTESRSTESRSNEQKSTESRSTEPRLTEPRLTEPRSTESRSNEQRSTESRSTDPRLTEPRSTEPSVKKFFVNNSEQVDWKDAFDFCQSHNMALAAIESEDQLLAAGRAMDDAGIIDYAWTSGEYVRVAGDFYWKTTGTRFSFTRWAPSEPHVFMDYLCVTLTKDDKTFWVGKCSDEFYVLCEYYS